MKTERGVREHVFFLLSHRVPTAITTPNYMTGNTIPPLPANGPLLFCFVSQLVRYVGQSQVNASIESTIWEPKAVPALQLRPWLVPQRPQWNHHPPDQVVHQKVLIHDPYLQRPIGQRAIPCSCARSLRRMLNRHADCLAEPRSLCTEVMYL